MEEINDRDEYDNGVDRRVIKRRYTYDRRGSEKVKRYAVSVVAPILIGCVAAGLISWGAYVTHSTYTIRANYEMTFVKHLEEQVKRNTIIDRRFEMIQIDYSKKMDELRTDMGKVAHDTHQSLEKIYKLLVEHEKTRSSRIRKNEE